MAPICNQISRVTSSGCSSVVDFVKFGHLCHKLQSKHPTSLFSALSFRTLLTPRHPVSALPNRPSPTLPHPSPTLPHPSPPFPTLPLPTLLVVTLTAAPPAGETWSGLDPCDTYQCVRNEIRVITHDCPEIKACAQVSAMSRANCARARSSKESILCAMQRQECGLGTLSPVTSLVSAYRTRWDPSVCPETAAPPASASMTRRAAHVTTSRGARVWFERSTHTWDVLESKWLHTCTTQAMESLS